MEIIKLYIFIRVECNKYYTIINNNIFIFIFINLSLLYGIIVGLHKDYYNYLLFKFFSNHTLEGIIL